MSLEWEQVNVDSADPEASGRWCAAALGWVIVNEIGQGAQTWVVLRDPEGNEFCVLASRP